LRQFVDLDFHARDGQNARQVAMLFLGGEIALGRGIGIQRQMGGRPTAG
jgi:hypothetical protein